MNYMTTNPAPTFAVAMPHPTVPAANYRASCLPKPSLLVHARDSIRVCREVLQRQRHDRRLERIYQKFREHTMVSPREYVTNLRIAESVKAVSGCVIECGVWRGGMIGGIARLMGEAREYLLFDSFEGLPEPDAIDGPAAVAWSKNTAGTHYHDNCRAEIGFAEEAMKIAGASKFRCVKGWFNDTIPGFVMRESIALLRLDADWYGSTTVCLAAFAKRMSAGGAIVIDDYYTWDGCAAAVHDYLSVEKLSWRISQVGGVCVIRT